MLQVVNNTIQETLTTPSVASFSMNGIGQTTGCGDWTTTGYCGSPIYWNQYPVYVCTDKTKKAIEVLKALQAEKMLTCNSVPRFIELVEKISNLL